MTQQELIGLGQLIATERKAKGFTQEELAKKMCLCTQRIQDMEAENFSKLPFAYARGYVKICAKILTLDEQEVLTKFDSLNLKNQKEKHREKYSYIDVVTRSNKKLTKERHYIRWINTGVIAILLALIYLWHTHNNYNTNPKSQDSSEIVNQTIIPPQEPAEQT